MYRFAGLAVTAVLLPAGGCNSYWIRSGSRFISWNIDTDAIVLTNLTSDPDSNTDVSVERPKLVDDFKTHIDAWTERYEK